MSAGAAARDAVLDVHRQRRQEAIRAAQDIALEIAARQGTVTSTEVLQAMRERCPEVLAANPDKRWLGAVLLPSLGWERTGDWMRTGSNARPVPVWRRA